MGYKSENGLLWASTLLTLVTMGLMLTLASLVSSISEERGENVRRDWEHQRRYAELFREKLRADSVIRAHSIAWE